MDIKLRLNEKRRLDVKLHAEGAMHLKVIRVYSRRLVIGAVDICDRTWGGDVEGHFSSAYAAFHDGNDARAGDRLPNRIEIVKPRAHLQSCLRKEVSLGKAESVFTINAKVRPEHEVHAKYSKYAADGAPGLASGGKREVRELARRTRCARTVELVDRLSRGVCSAA